MIYPGENGYWVAECPSLPGCVSQGTSREEAITNIKEAIEGYIAVLEEDGEPISEALEAQLLKSMEAPAREIRPVDWDAKRQRLADLHREGRL